MTQNEFVTRVVNEMDCIAKEFAMHPEEITERNESHNTIKGTVIYVNSQFDGIDMTFEILTELHLSNVSEFTISTYHYHDNKRGRSARSTIDKADNCHILTPSNGIHISKSYTTSVAGVVIKDLHLPEYYVFSDTYGDKTSYPIKTYDTINRGFARQLLENVSHNNIDVSKLSDSDLDKLLHLTATMLKTQKQFDLLKQRNRRK